ncbi:type I-G CRISPR-associated protein Csb2 [Prosthecodimorpha staleyi]|uniref:Type I-U CRISPR-associated protein Cas5/Cas6 n=1 Tax=Prosthecodimorpha staleyi TaxID=2840188 RepID=A0A947D9I3_9HYPH|nr:type I-U CRISPR-associated protein Csb2 [Prosthecodimorpha staleyi]MBT9290787.1 type I-U CRISPR-associated protein Cas5/Cas6 [Prosthecodimorpha staleyi]
MTLVLEVEHLTGTAFAALGPDTDAPDWPPQPDRIFSALVASWAARGSRDDERAALEWLERLDPPLIEASSGLPRRVPIHFVPPNDPGTGRSGDRSVMPQFRRRQPRRFPAFRPDDPTVRYRWCDAVVDPATLEALIRLAADTAYVGHSASLTRCRFLLDGTDSAPHALLPARRRVYPGRLQELRDGFASGRRPRPGDRATATLPPATERSHSVFASQWLLLEVVEADDSRVDGRPSDAGRPRVGVMPDLRAAAVVAKAIRDAVISGYKAIGLGDRVPALVSGHEPDRSPTRMPHMAVVPLAFTGVRHADGRVLGFAIVPPRGSGLLDDADFGAAMRALVRRGEEGSGGSRPVMRIWRTAKDGHVPFEIALAPTLQPTLRTLDPLSYTAPARVFATVTPIVLDRHLKATGAAKHDEIVQGIVAACRNIGLPEPEMIETRWGPRPAVVPEKHSAVVGAPSAWPSGGAPVWTRWRLPPSLASRPLTHAVLRFAEPIEGPVILGAGRHVGLGLCRAYPDLEPGVER